MCEEIDTEWLRDHMRNFIANGAGPNLPGTEHQFHGEAIAEQAIEFLKIADEKVRSAELAKCAAEAELKRYRDQVKDQIDTKIHQIEEQMERTASQLAAAEQRATAAEERANEAEATVRRLEDDLQAQMIRTRARLVRPAA
jgi:outer membrane murein-binding lipoprotein Lpp